MALAERPSEGRRSAPLIHWIKSILKTLGTIAITMLGLLFVTFIIGRVMPIDPVLAIVGERASQSTYDAVYQDLGLDKPLLVQFGYYLWDVLHGDFGDSLLIARPVSEDIARVFPATLELATLGVLIGIFLGVPLGVIAAVKRGSWIDQIARVVALVGYSMPIFLAGAHGAAGLLRHTWLGRRAGSAGHLLRRYCAHAHRLDPGGQCYRPGLGRLPQCVVTYHPSRDLVGLLFAGLYQPNDPVVHAGTAVSGICHYRPRQRPVRAASDLAACLQEHPCTAHYSHRTKLCQPSGGIGSDRDHL